MTKLPQGLPLQICRGLALCLSLTLGASPYAYATKAPLGIYCLMNGDRVDREQVQLEGHPVWKNAAIDGVLLRTFWDKIEPAEGIFNWAHFDEGVRLAREAHKTVGLSLAGGMRTPAWVYAAGARRFSFSWKTHFTATEEREMTLPWDEVFLAHWERIIAAMAERYDGAAEVSMVTIGGLGFAVETNIVKSPADANRLNEFGGLEAWEAGAKKIIDIYARHFRQTPFHLVLAQPGPDPRAWDILRRVCAYGTSRYPGRFGVSCHGLNARSGLQYVPNALVHEISSVSPSGFQMVWSTEGPSAALLKGTLREALDRAVELSGHWVEVYAHDCVQDDFQDDLKAAHLRLHQAHDTKKQ